MASPPSIPDEISEFLHRNAEKINHLPQIINIAFSGERKPEAWHVRIINKQVSRGFNKAAPVTIMLPLKSWRKLMKKNDPKLWKKALDDGQIHIHGDTEASNSILELFGVNGNKAEEKRKQSDAQHDSPPIKVSRSNGKAKTSRTKKASTKQERQKKQKKTAPVATGPE